MKLKTIALKNKKLILSLFIFFLVFLTLGLPFYKWGFIGDDFGAIFHSMVNGWKDLLKFFYEGDACAVYMPSNYVIPEQSFFSVFYRPLIFVFYWLQSLCWGADPYLYFLIIIFIHALNSVLLFNIFLGFVDELLAFLGALFFAFHANICGWIATQQYFLEVFFVLLIFIFLKQYLDSNNLRYYLGAVLIFVLALFTRETTIVLPLLIFMVGYLFVYKKYSFINSFSLSLGFWLVSMMYLILRLFLFPLNMERGIYNIVVIMKKILVSLIFSSYMCSGLAPFFRDNFIIRYFLVFLFNLLLVFLFWKSQKKKELIFLIVTIFLFSWPNFLVASSGRYIYIQLPFFILFVLICFNFYFRKKMIFRNLLVFCFCLVIFYNFISLKKGLAFFEYRSNFATVAIKEFVVLNRSNIDGKKLCFLGLPWEYFYTGVAQAVWLRGVNLRIPIYYDDSTWGILSEIETGNFLKIFPIKNGYRFVSVYPEKLWFSTGYTPLKMGEKVIHETCRNGVSDFDWIIDQKYLDQNPVFISWDYKSQRFLILDPPLK